MTAYIEIQDISLVAALLAVGIPFIEDTPYLKIRTGNDNFQYKFFLQEGSICGCYDTQKLVRGWNDPQFHIDNPEHPFAYLKCAFMNREGLLDKVKQDLGMVVIEKQGKLAVISKNASPDLQQKIFSQF